MGSLLGKMNDDSVVEDSIIKSKYGCLWTPNRVADTNIYNFMKYVNEKCCLNIKTYDELQKWSIRDYPTFWSSWWEYGNFVRSAEPIQIVDENTEMNKIPKWFVGAYMNFAENLLRFKDDQIAIYATGERGGDIETLTYSELYKRTMRVAKALKRNGVESGDRVCGYLPNGILAVEAMLATATLGAIWSSTSPDIGATGVLERFSQIEPKILFTVEAVPYNGKTHDHLEKVKEVSRKLKPQKVIISPFLKEREDIDISHIPNGVFLDEFLENGENNEETVEFVQVPFSHPLFIMFSSGTTGVPKCIVHSVGGTLIQIAKEHILHCDLRRSDVFMYYTTTSWMMWNWLVVGLFTGCSIVLYDGSPLLPTVTSLWDLVDKIGITVIGTGAKWLSVLEQKDIKPIETHSLDSLRTILSTGSVLSSQSFKYVYKYIKKDIMLGSITGGTDIISCFIGCCPIVPVYTGQLQCPLLGMSVEAKDPDGNTIFDCGGELVCTRPFPSMPIYFWSDSDSSKYFNAYFSRYKGIWTHGDYCIFHGETGGVTMLGRSDGTLNPNGVRFGSAELYNIVEHFSEIEDSLCIGQTNSLKEERVLLFVVMKPGFEFNSNLVKKIKMVLRKELSARHVPSLILPIKDIPYTMSGKKVEVAVRNIIHKKGVLNRESFRNPESLELFNNLPELADW